jgi:hypothetical protein|tara:strand:+ start:5691 stop:5882 length:192 start_codon:yes stop_codon:yes gene_type:complete
MADLVSPCCGTEYTELTFRTEEHMYRCSNCDESFAIPEKDYEYDEAGKENKAEAQLDADRDES